ncbi:MAG: bifunctional aconitate hydratase 2/2-methylisocitrate dehydratase, partial [Methylococcaceae bacterium]
MLETYRKHVAERAAEGIIPKPLDAGQTAALCELIKQPPAGEEAFILDLLANRIPAGVDEAAYVKAGFLTAIAKSEATSPILTPEDATELLGTMLGGYNVAPLIELLDTPSLAPIAAKALAHTLLVFDAFHDVQAKADTGNAFAKQVMQSWADAEWFNSKPPVPEKLTVTVFKVAGETNTDDLSPAPDAWSRPDIPLHAKAMLKMPREGITNAEQQIAELKQKGFPVAYVGDVVGTGSSRKSATNSVLWYMGNDIPFIPNKRDGGVCIGGKIAPIFFNTMEDSGALPFECDVTRMLMGDVIDIYPYQGVVKRHDSDEVVCKFELKTDVLLDEVRAGGRIPLIIGRGLTDRARKALGLFASTVFIRPTSKEDSGKGYTLAQKIV